MRDEMVIGSAHAKMLANTGLRRCRAAAGAALHLVPRAPRPAPIPAKSLISFMPTGEQETNSSLVARGAPRPRGQGGRGEWHMETGWCGGPSATNFLLKYSGRMALAYSVVSCPGCCSTSAAYRLQGLPWPLGIVGPAVLPVLRELLGQDEGRR